MKTALKKVLMVMLGITLCAGIFAPKAMAVTQSQAEIPVTVHMTGEGVPDEDIVSAEIKAITPDAPMPENHKIDIVCNGSEAVGTGTFVMQYSTLGVYEYQITIQDGDNEDANYGANPTYDVAVTVMNNHDKGDVNVVAQLSGNQEKGEITDTNEYPLTQELTVVKKWDINGKNHPDSVEVTLYNGDNAVTSVLLGDWNNWSYSWGDLDCNSNWKVLETNIPKGYAPSYSYWNNITTITNTESLIQTGQLSWPVPIMGAIGLVLITCGFIIIAKKRKDKYV